MGIRGPILGALGALALACALVAGPPAALAETCPGRNGNIAVVVNGDVRGSSYIAIVSMSGHARPLFAPPGVQASFLSPSFSCNGRRLIYGGNNGGPSFTEVADARTGEKLPPHAPGEGWGFPQFPFPLARSFDSRGTYYLRNGDIVFTRSGAEGHAPPGTFVVRADGSGSRRLFAQPAVAGTVDGRWFIGGTPGTPAGVHLLNSKGGTVPWSTLSLGGARDLCFSPDGRRVVYSKEGDLYVVRRDGSHRRRLTDDGESQSPVFSPDGRWVAFLRGEPPRTATLSVVALSPQRSRRAKVLARLPQASSIVGGLAWSVR